jgi:hypothetical protein
MATSAEGFQPREIPVPSNHPTVGVLAAQSSYCIFEAVHRSMNQNHNNKDHCCSNGHINQRDRTRRRSRRNTTSSTKSSTDAAVRTQEFKSAAVAAAVAIVRSSEVLVGEALPSNSLSPRKDAFFIHKTRRRYRKGNKTKKKKKTNGVLEQPVESNETSNPEIIETSSSSTKDEKFRFDVCSRFRGMESPLRPKDTLLRRTVTEQPPSRAKGSVDGFSTPAVAPLDRQHHQHHQHQESGSRRSRSRAPLSPRRRAKAKTKTSSNANAPLVERGAETSEAPNQPEEAEAESILHGIICGRAPQETKAKVSEWSSRVGDAAAAAVIVPNDFSLSSPLCQIYKNCYCEYCFDVGSQWKAKECTPNHGNPRNDIRIDPKSRDNRNRNTNSAFIRQYCRYHRAQANENLRYPHGAEPWWVTKKDCRTSHLEETLPPRVALFHESFLHRTPTPTPTIQGLGETSWKRPEESSPNPEQQRRFVPTTYTTATMDSRAETGMDLIKTDDTTLPSAISSTSTQTVWWEASDEGRDDIDNHDYDGDDESNESRSWSSDWLLQGNRSVKREKKRRLQPTFGGQQQQQQKENQRKNIPQQVLLLPMFRSIWRAHDRYGSISSVSSSNMAV